MKLHFAFIKEGFECRELLSFDVLTSFGGSLTLRQIVYESDTILLLTFGLMWAMLAMSLVRLEWSIML